MTASSIHGTGAQNLLKALRMRCAEVSGMEFGPNLFRRIPASALERPLVDKLGGTVVAGKGEGRETVAAGVITRTPYRSAS
jgi:hypothetical protein